MIDSMIWDCAQHNRSANERLSIGEDLVSQMAAEAIVAVGLDL